MAPHATAHRPPHPLNSVAVRGRRGDEEWISIDTVARPEITGARRYTDDDGSADPSLRAALDAYSRGAIRHRGVLNAIGAARLLVPVVAVATEREHTDDGLTRDKRSEVAVPVMKGDDGRLGVLAFTSVDTLRRWRRNARPVPFSAPEACQATLDEGADALVVDVAGPVAYAVQGPFLRKLATDGTVPEPKHDPEVLAVIYRITHTEFGIERVRLSESEKTDLAIRLELQRRDDSELRRVAKRLTEELRTLLPGGIDLSAVVRARRAGD